MSPICIPLRIKDVQTHLICQEAEEALEQQAWQDVKGPHGERVAPSPTGPKRCPNPALSEEVSFN